MPASHGLIGKSLTCRGSILSFPEWWLFHLYGLLVLLPPGCSAVLCLSIAFPCAPSHLSEMPRQSSAIDRMPWNTFLTHAVD